MELIKTELTPKERIRLYEAGEEVDRIPTGLDVSDAHNGLRVLSASAARSIRLRQNRMAHASEILEEIGKHGLSYVEVPVHIRYTEYSMAKGQSGLGAFNILFDLLLARLRK